MRTVQERHHAEFFKTVKRAGRLCIPGFFFRSISREVRRKKQPGWW
jgi:hypothetical protein